MNKITCQIICDLLPLYHDCVCSADSREAVEAHLSGCTACKKKYEQMQAPVIAEQADQRTQGDAAASFHRFIRRLRAKAFQKGIVGGMVAVVLVSLVAFYLLPLFMVDTGSGMLILLVLIPAVCFVSALVYGLLAGIRWFYPIGMALLFLPAIFIHFNSSAFFYVFFFGGIALLGNVIGGLIHKATHKN